MQTPLSVPVPVISDETAPVSPAALLAQWLERRLSAENYQWLSAQFNKIERANSDRDLHITLGLIPRKLGRDDLALTTQELKDSGQCIEGWHPVHWSIDIAARVWLLSHQTTRGDASFGELVADLCRTADLAESIALYSGLPLYPVSEALDQVVADGLRSNVKAVFEAIAHHNPYPDRFFSDSRWNHMVLKALFVNSKLSPIVGLDKRRNAELAEILCDYAHERWAAQRPVSIELWRCVGPFATGPAIDDLSHVVENGSATERNAALLALSESNDARAASIVESYPDIAGQITRCELTWDSLVDDENQHC